MYCQLNFSPLSTSGYYYTGVSICEGISILRGAAPIGACFFFCLKWFSVNFFWGAEWFWYPHSTIASPNWLSWLPPPPLRYPDWSPPPKLLLAQIPSLRPRHSSAASLGYASTRLIILFLLTFRKLSLQYALMPVMKTAHHCRAQACPWLPDQCVKPKVTAAKLASVVFWK